MRWFVAALVAGCALLTGSVIGPAAGFDAELDPEALTEQLQRETVVIDARSTISVDEDAVREAFGELPVPTYLVVLPQREVDAVDSGIDGVLLRVLEALDDPRSVLVVVTDAGELQAGEAGASGVQASALLDRIVQERSDQEFGEPALTAALLEFADAVEAGSDEGAERGVEGLDRRTVGVAGLTVVALIAGAWLWLRSQRKVTRESPLSDAEAHTGSW